MLVEVNEARNAAHDVGVLVHDNNGGGSQPSLGLDQGVKVHHHVIANAAQDKLWHYAHDLTDRDCGKAGLSQRMLGFRCQAWEWDKALGEERELGEVLSENG